MESAKWDYLFFVCTVTACVFLSNYSFAVVLECPADGRTWVPLGNNCYCFFHLPKSSTIEDVREACRVNVPSADVVSINSEAENSFVTDYSHRIWNGTKNVWLGMSFNVDTDSLTWFDGLDVVYTNWMHGDAYSEDTPVDMCAILHTGSGKWEKVSCEEVSEKAVVCETPMNPPKEKVAANNQALLSALVILSVVVILVGSTVCWFFYQKKYSSSTVFTPFNYYPPFSTPNSDETFLVDAEERE
ncbi:CD302 antigen [Acipenser oxyrinchus oxyrinchus]|uniref:CD302 antigen n=1 Tax=Acipenser oxyrinchus oxyrinchus TaxID=40147 RepID=A0AAD8G6E6_ACIOX|nr:CD302 antigen [Acipenser oxyrinchus oxyrinchus]